MIESLDIPVMIDRSSYESHPLGRTEWIKLYAAMLNKEDAADAFFEKQVENVDALKDFKNTEKTVAFFYVSSDGTVVVRRSDDYIPKMIELSGGRYVFDDLTGDDSNTSAVKLTMEEFYAQAADADYLIYNSSIDNPINSVKDLEEKDALFSDFKAVKEGNVWCTCLLYTSCSKCARNCPAGAIEGVLKSPYHINQEKCIKCGACMEQCPFKAIHIEK